MVFANEVFALLTIFWIVCTTQVKVANSICPKECSCFEEDATVFCSRMTLLPKSFPVKTGSLILSELTIDRIPQDAFKGLTSLKTIDIKSSKIESLEQFSFRNLENLSTISFSYCNIGNIESNAFYNIRNVSSLTFSMSSIDTIQANAFNGLRTINSIDLSSLNVDVVENFAFEKLEHIGSFSFHDSNITTLSPNALHGWHHISNFAIAHNFFTAFQCGNVESAIVVANQTVFHNNIIPCQCGLSWVLDNRDKLTNFLTSNWCIDLKSDEITFASLTPEILGCDKDGYACKSDISSTKIAAVNVTPNVMGSSRAISDSTAQPRTIIDSNRSMDSPNTTQQDFISYSSTRFDKSDGVFKSTIGVSVSKNLTWFTEEIQSTTQKKLLSSVVVTSNLTTENNNAETYAFATQVAPTEVPGSDVKENGNKNKKGSATNTAIQNRRMSPLLAFVALCVIALNLQYEW